VNLDLSRAIIESPVVDIELLLRFGGAKITLPADASIDIDDLNTVWKQPVYKTPRRIDDGRPRIRISGTMEYGRLAILVRGRSQRAKVRKSGPEALARWSTTPASYRPCRRCSRRSPLAWPRR
jgi:hypothetical protein